METDISGANNPNWRGGTTKAKCVDCGKEISKYHKRCKSCARKGELHPNYKGGPPKCPDCGKEVSRSHKGRCRECWAKHNQGENNANYAGGAKKCIDCGIELLYTKPSSTSKRCKQCHHEYAKREKHPNWKGGLLTVEQAIRSTKEFDSWVKAVKDRDARSCQRCHTKVGIETHHIIPLGIIIDGLRYRNSDAGDEEILSIAKRFALIWDISNGTTLCHKCHMGKHKKLRTEEYNPCQ